MAFATAGTLVNEYKMLLGYPESQHLPSPKTDLRFPFGQLPPSLSGFLDKSFVLHHPFVGRSPYAAGDPTVLFESETVCACRSVFNPCKVQQGQVDFLRTTEFKIAPVVAGQVVTNYSLLFGG